MNPRGTTEPDLPAGLADWVARTPVAALLPSRHAEEAGRVVGSLELVDHVRLSPAVLVAVARDGEGMHYPLPLVEAGGGRWQRAVAGDGAALSVVAHVTDPQHRGRPGGFETLCWLDGDAGLVAGQGEERSVDVDQTNESVVVGERAVVKWTVRATLDPAPALQRLSALVSAGFAGTPRPWGALTWRGVLIATVVEFLPGATDGWDWAVQDVRALARKEISLSEATSAAAVLGDLVARMHHALPRRGVASEATAALWHAHAEADLETAVAVVDGAEGVRLRHHAAELRAILAPLREAGGTALLDAHGDLHVGQVLRWHPPGSLEAAYSVTDFDGNPVLSGPERAAPAPAAVDVAGLLQSLDHVGRVVLYRTPGVEETVVAGWIDTAQRELLRSYLAVDTAVPGDQGAGPLLDVQLLPALRARQLVREYLYAVRHLPHWRYVPDTALPALLATAAAERSG